MKVFISSLTTGMEQFRAAAKSAVTTLNHDPVLAEDFGALPHSPQIACLHGVRQSGAVILLLGSRYGVIQPSGLSPTHEEYREAHGRCPVLAFVEEGVTPEPQQAKFIDEVKAWDRGLIRVAFSDAGQLERKIVRALHNLDLANAATPFDAKELLTRTLALLPKERGSNYSGGALLSVAVGGGPAQAILRPSQIEEPALAEALEKEALYGSVRLLARGSGTTASIRDGALFLEQNSQRSRETRSIQLDPQGGILIRLPVEGENHGMGILVETVQEYLFVALRFAAWVLDHVDPRQRLSHVVIAATLVGGFALRTRREHEASPTSMQVSSSHGRDERVPVYLSPAHLSRSGLTQQAEQVVDDLIILIRRQWQS